MRSTSLDFSKFKYNLNKLISELPNSISMEWLANELSKEGIAVRNFYRDKAAKVTQLHDIPGERLLIYSKFFNVPVPQIYNYTKPVVYVIDRLSKSKVKPIHRIKTGLKATVFILFMIVLQGCVSYAGLKTQCPAYANAKVIVPVCYNSGGRLSPSATTEDRPGRIVK